MKAKNKQISQVKNPEKLPLWNLSDLYKSKSSKELTNDLNFIKIKTKKFEKKYFNKLHNLNSKQLYQSIFELEKIDMVMDKILSYAHLLVAQDGNNEKNKIFFQQMQEIITKYASSILFFNVELNQIPELRLNKLLKNKNISVYKNWILTKRSFKPFQLNLDLEKFLQDKNITSHSAWIRLFDDIITSLKFSYKKKYLTISEIFNLLSDKDTVIRKIAAKSIGKTLEKNINFFSTITNTLAKDKSINDEWRKLPSPVSARNLSNVVEDQVVDSLVDSVVDSYPRVSHRYYSLKAKWFQKKKINVLGSKCAITFSK